MSTAPFQQRRFAGAAGALHVAIGPASGPPLVLLHGVTRRWQDWTPLLASLSMRWQIFALDFRGHGGSARAPGKYLVCHYVEDAVALLEREVMQPAVILGHSLGAMVAAGAASATPALVRAVVMEDPPFDTLGPGIGSTPFHAFFAGVRDVCRQGGDVETVAARLAEIRVPRLDGSGAVRLGDVRDATSLRFSARCLADVDPEVLEPLVAGRWLEGYDTSSRLHGVKCPALLLQADYSAGGMLPDADAERALSALVHGSRVRVAGVGHLLHWLATEATQRYVSGFLESL